MARRRTKLGMQTDNEAILLLLLQLQNSKDQVSRIHERTPVPSLALRDPHPLAHTHTQRTHTRTHAYTHRLAGVNARAIIDPAG